ncbi:pyruvate, phosphate dikinase [Lentzea alba]|uniref:pyruvate, phosphate dikinase n=1 Tax=Lentzea alba TaxID=2714351 RepID=UPI0039BEF740
MTSPYGGYLDVPALLSLQRPLTDVPDEYLFIVTHQALELWFAEALHEIDQVIGAMTHGELTAARHGVQRLHRIVRLWLAHLDVLDTMPAKEFAAFRPALGNASGLQSGQFRELELASGLARDGVLRIARAVGSDDVNVRRRAGNSSLRQSFLDLLQRAGITVSKLYDPKAPNDELRALAEDLVEYDMVFSQWRYRHYLMVLHAIGVAPGTAGSEGFSYLRKTLDKWFFPELWSARSMSEKPPASPVAFVVPLDGSVTADRAVLGGKGWGLQQMNQLGIPVPPAFTLTTRACHEYFRNDGTLPEEIWAEVLTQLEMLERRTGSRFGSSPSLLVSVRSGAPVSMPGMMDTILNVGLTHASAAWQLDELSSTLRESFPDLPTLVAFDSDGTRTEALAQLRSAICRIFDSWHSDRARIYRQANGIPDDLGTAVTVQAMVFGNRDERSGTGVYVTRNPITGEAVPFGEWLPRAQGEDLVAGKRTPLPLTALSEEQPEIYRQLIAIGQRLERAHRNVLEIEFTVESGELFLLQARNSSSSAVAAVHWAVDLVHEGLIDIPEALSRVPADWLPSTTEDAAVAASSDAPVATGLGVSPGFATGWVVDDADEAGDFADLGKPVILARPTTSPHDVHGFLVAAAVITERGGSTSHAAVVGRQIGLPCVVGCGDGVVKKLLGKFVTVDGSSGAVYEGDLTTRRKTAPPSPQIECLLRWRSESQPGEVLT